MHMTTHGFSSSSSAESTMDNARHRRSSNNNNNGGEDSAEVWGTFDRSFQKVQTVLDRNRALIQQVNDNHQSRSPDNMVKNVALIQEINSNINKVVSLYGDLNSDFSSACHHRSKA